MARDLSASQKYNEDYYEMLPQPMAVGGTNITETSGESTTTKVIENATAGNSTALKDTPSNSKNAAGVNKKDDKNINIFSQDAKTNESKSDK